VDHHPIAFGFQPLQEPPHLARRQAQIRGGLRLFDQLFECFLTTTSRSLSRWVMVRAPGSVTFPA
jgi:hypothetical protein